MKQTMSFVFALFMLCACTLPLCAAEVGQAAPEISAEHWFNAASFSLDSVKDKVVVVEFFATWCPPCRRSIQHIKEIYEKHKDKGLVVASLSNEDRNTIAAFNKKALITWVVGAESNSASDYGVSGIPHAFIIVDGKIVWAGHPMSGMEAEIEKQLEAKSIKPADEKTRD